MPIKFDPRIQAHLIKAKQRWENVDENVSLLVRYRIPFLDTHLYGIRVDTGELIVIVAEEKNRKTTLVINIVANIMTDPKLEKKPYTVIDVLESGMPTDRYTDQMISNLASRYLMSMGHVPVSHGACRICKGKCKELRICPEFLMFERKSPQQQKAIDWAWDEMYTWPIDIWGAGIHEGDTRNLETTLGDIDKKTSRWVQRVEEVGAKIFVSDHAQQYQLLNKYGFVTDYEKLVASVGKMGTFVAKYNAVVFLIAQTSLTSLREAMAGGKLRSSGGKKPHEEANVTISTKYEQYSGIMGVNLQGSRRSGTAKENIPIDDISGAIFSPNIYTFIEGVNKKLDYGF